MDFNVIPAGPFSPYQVIKFLNRLTGRNLPTQMGYNYVKQNLISASKTPEGRVFVEREELIRFITKYIEKNVTVK